MKRTGYTDMGISKIIIDRLGAELIWIFFTTEFTSCSFCYDVFLFTAE